MASPGPRPRPGAGEASPGPGLAPFPAHTPGAAPARPLQGSSRPPPHRGPLGLEGSREGVPWSRVLRSSGSMSPFCSLAWVRGSHTWGGLDPALGSTASSQGWWGCSTPIDVEMLAVLSPQYWGTQHADGPGRSREPGLGQGILYLGCWTLPWGLQPPARAGGGGGEAPHINVEVLAVLSPQYVECHNVCPGHSKEPGLVLGKHWVRVASRAADPPREEMVSHVNVWLWV